MRSRRSATGRWKSRPPCAPRRGARSGRSPCRWQRPGFLTGAVLGFAHTVGEFGLVLMIGGNIPGRTKVLSVAIFDYVEASQWREANILAAGMVIFAFAVILTMTLIEKRSAGLRRMKVDGPGHIQAAFRGSLGGFSLDASFAVPATGVTAMFGPSGCGKTTRGALPRRPAIPARKLLRDRRRRSGKTRSTFRKAHQRPVGYVFQEASLFSHLSVKRNLLYGAPRATGSTPRSRRLRRGDRAARPRPTAAAAHRSICPAASASASRSAARCCRSPSCC